MHHGDVRVEQHRAGVAPYRIDDVVLDRALRLGVGRKPRRFKRLDERVTVVGGDDGEQSAEVSDPCQRADLG